MAAARRLRLIVDGAAPGALNMAVDDVLLEGVSRFAYTLRFYRWTVPTVSLGYGQKWRSGYDLAVARRRGIRLVRRRTGGRAVLHHGELTYSIAGPAEAGPLAGGIQATYRVVSEGFVAGLASIGVVAEVVRSRGRRETDAAGACFAARALHEVTAGGRKLLGSAQRRQRGRVLQHGSLLLAAPRPELWRVLGPSGAAAAATAVGLDELGVRLAPDQLARVLGRAVARELELTVVAANLASGEVRAARRHSAVYRSDAHTRRR